MDKKRRVIFVRLFSLAVMLVVPFSFFSWAGTTSPIENEACLQCHGIRDIARLAGEKNTAHRQLKCIDCHADIQQLPHPQRLGSVSCARCHAEITGQYGKSAHARISRLRCVECHDPHATTSFKKLPQQERMGFCLRCHEKDGHHWLPQKDLHFRHLECAACHAPQAEKGIVFQLQGADNGSETVRLGYTQIAELMGVATPDLGRLLDSDGNGLLEDREVLSFLQSLKDKNPGKKIELAVKVRVFKPSHSYSKDGSSRDCSPCHSARAEFYRKLIMEIPERGGGIKTLPIEKSILTRIHTIPVTSSFYLLGESRISKRDMAELLFPERKIGYKWLDIMGILCVLTALTFVAIHAFFRIVSIGIRRRKRYK